MFGRPLATPSANITGKPSGTNYENIIKDFENKIDYFIDNGESKLGISSTVIRIIDNNLQVYREGVITKEKIQKVIDDIKKNK